MLMGMRMRSLGIFAAGFATGWIGRSTVGSTREATVRLLVAFEGLRTGAHRIFVEQLERIEDAFAEGRARYDEIHAVPPIDDDAPPFVTHAPVRENA